MENTQKKAYETPEIEVIELEGKLLLQVQSYDGPIN